MNTAKVLKEITDFGVTNEELQEDYGISSSTLINYNTKKTEHKRTSASMKTIDALYHALKIISKHHGFNPAKEVREIRFESNESFPEFLKKYEKSGDSELIKYAIELRVESFLKERETLAAIDEFRKIYTYINPDTLEDASIEHPYLLQRIVLDDSISALTRSHALFSLSIGYREEYYSFIKVMLAHPSPFIRESAFMGLYEYYAEGDEARKAEIRQLLTVGFHNEKATGVKSKLRLLLENIAE